MLLLLQILSNLQHLLILSNIGFLDLVLLHPLIQLIDCEPKQFVLFVLVC